MLAPIEFAAVDDDASNGGAMAANPLGCRVDNNISSVVNWSDEITTSTKSIVNLMIAYQ